MSNTTVIVTDSGKSKLNDLIVAGQSISITKYEVGDQGGYTPVTSQTSLQGTVVFSDQSSGAGNAQLTVTKVADHTFSINLFLDASIGDFTVGEYAFKFSDGTLLAVAVLPQTTQKVKTTTTVAGNSLNLSSVLAIANAGDTIDVTLSQTVHNSINEILTEAALPPIATASSNVYLVRNYNSTNAFAVAYKDANAAAWRFITQIQDDDIEDDEILTADATTRNAKGSDKFISDSTDWTNDKSLKVPTKYSTDNRIHDVRPSENLFKNSDFSVGRSSTLHSSTTDTPIENWYFDGSGSYFNVQKIDFTPGSPEITELPHVKSYVRALLLSSNDNANIRYVFDDLQRYVGKTYTVSVYLKGVSSGLSTNIILDYGIGGSQIDEVINPFIEGSTLSTTWSKFTVTFTVPSGVGKTFGTNSKLFFVLRNYNNEVTDIYFTNPTMVEGILPTSQAKSKSLSYSKFNSRYNENFIINGDLRIWQRGTSFAQTGGTNYFADRFYGRRGGNEGNMTVSRVAADGLPFDYAMRVQRGAGDTSQQGLVLSYNMESNDSRLLAGKTITFSLYVRKGADYIKDGGGNDAGTFTMTLWYGSGDDEYGNPFSGFASLISNDSRFPKDASTDWQRYHLTSKVPDNCTQIMISLFGDARDTTVPAGANDYLDLTGVKLEVGDTPTPFVSRPISQEISMCQRYYEKSYALEETPGLAIPNGSNYLDIALSVIYSTSIHFQVLKRVAPTVVTYDDIGTPNAVTTALGNAKPSSVIWSTEKGISVTPTIIGDRSTFMRYHYTADAEL